MALLIQYNGKVSATLESGPTATIPCKGKKMLTELIVDTISGLPAGLYDESYKLLASWELLTTQYGLDVEKDYQLGAYNDTSALYHIIESNSKLSNGVNLIMPDSVTKIGNYAFQYCDNLADIAIGNKVTTIGVGAFYVCTNLTTITIPNSVTSIGNGAFYDCISLSSITIPNSVKTIGEMAFYKCTNLMSITLPNGVTSINEAVFYDCTSLADIIIPASVTSIGEEAFYNCTSLANVYYRGTFEKWKAMSVGSGNDTLLNVTIQYNYAGQGGVI